MESSYVPCVETQSIQYCELCKKEEATTPSTRYATLVDYVCEKCAKSCAKEPLLKTFMTQDVQHMIAQLCLDRCPFIVCPLHVEPARERAKATT